MNNYKIKIAILSVVLLVFNKHYAMEYDPVDYRLVNRVLLDDLVAAHGKVKQSFSERFVQGLKNLTKSQQQVEANRVMDEVLNREALSRKIAFELYTGKRDATTGEKIDPAKQQAQANLEQANQRRNSAAKDMAPSYVQSKAGDVDLRAARLADTIETGANALNKDFKSTAEQLEATKKAATNTTLSPEDAKLVNLNRKFRQSGLAMPISKTKKWESALRNLHMSERSIAKMDWSDIQAGIVVHDNDVLRNAGFTEIDIDFIRTPQTLINSPETIGIKNKLIEGDPEVIDDIKAFAKSKGVDETSLVNRLVDASLGDTLEAAQFKSRYHSQKYNAEFGKPGPMKIDDMVSLLKNVRASEGVLLNKMGAKQPEIEVWMKDLYEAPLSKFAQNSDKYPEYKNVYELLNDFRQKFGLAQKTPTELKLDIVALSERPRFAGEGGAAFRTNVLEPAIRVEAEFRAGTTGTTAGTGTTTGTGGTRSVTGGITGGGMPASIVTPKTQAEFDIAFRNFNTGLGDFRLDFNRFGIVSLDLPAAGFIRGNIAELNKLGKTMTDLSRSGVDVDRFIELSKTKTLAEIDLELNLKTKLNLDVRVNLPNFRVQLPRGIL